MVPEAYADNKIPIDTLKDVSNVLGVTMSSDGYFYSVTSMDKASPVVRVYSLRQDESFVPQTYTLPESLVSTVQWMDSNRLIVSYTIIEKDGRGRKKNFYREWAVIDLKTRSLNRILNYKVNKLIANGPDKLLSVLPDDPDHIMISYPEKRKYYPAIFKVNIHTGEVTKLRKAKEPVTSWIVDKEGNPVIGSGYGDGKNTILVSGVEGENLIDIGDRPLFQNGYFEPLEQGITNSTMFVSSSISQGRRKIYHYDYRNHVILSKVFEHDRVDVSNIIYSTTKEKVLAALYVDQKMEYEFFDDELKNLFQNLNDLLPDRSNYFLDVSDDESRYLISSVMENSPPQYYIYDVNENTVTLIANRGSGLQDYQLASVEPVTYFSRDGLEIHSFLTKPVGNNSEPMPAVIMPHGGPWVRDTLGFHDWAQFFANRGYLVLQPNFRGSTGYGTTFTNMGNGEWGEKMQDDLTDGVRWLIRQGLADPNRICIAGGSYGGYASLMGVVKDPDIYQCAISFAPVTDLKTYFDTYKRAPNGDQVSSRVRGTKPKSFIKTSSPSKRAKEIKVPILLVHGDSDIRVDIKHSEIMRKALERADVEHEFIQLESGSHFLLQSEHKEILYTAMEEFLQKHLGTE